VAGLQKWGRAFSAIILVLQRYKLNIPVANTLSFFPEQNSKVSTD